MFNIILSNIKTYRHIFYAALLQLILHGIAFAQPVHFAHINSSMGLSGNSVTSVVTDKNNLLWIGTNNGLNMYDGYRVTSFADNGFRDIANIAVTSLLCDEYNNIWVGTMKGIYLLDADRRVLKIKALPADDEDILYMLEKNNHEIVVHTKKSFYLLTNGKNTFGKSPGTLLRPDMGTVKMARLAEFGREFTGIGNDQYLTIVKDTLSIIDFSGRTPLFSMVIKNACTACRIDENSLLVGTYIGQLYKVDMAAKKIVKEFGLPEEISIAPQITDTRKIRLAKPGLAIITTFFGGVFFLDIESGKFTHYRHNPLDANSLSENRADNIFFDKNGNIFISTQNTGLNYCNIGNYYAQYTPVLTGDDGTLFDGFVNDITEDGAGNIWLASYDKAICQERQSGKAGFLPYYQKFLAGRTLAMEIKAICKDNSSRIWASIYGVGVAIINPATKSYKLITHLGPDNKTQVFVSLYVHDIYADKSNKIWACSNTGVFNIDATTFRSDSLPAPSLSALSGKRVIKIWGDAKDNIWFATVISGAYCLNKSTGKLKNYTIANGLPDNNCHAFETDKKNNIYIATAGGLAMLRPDGSIKTFSKNDGLIAGDCSSLQADDDGGIWLVMNNKTLVYYSPEDNRFRYFGEESGFGNTGFRYGSGYKGHDGTIYWGNNRGFSSFNPRLLLASSSYFKLSIQKLILPDTSFYFTGSFSHVLNYTNNNVDFYFAAANLTGSKNIYYQYRLVGFDKDWISGIDVTEAKYSSLLPGQYTFKVRASKDGVKWNESSNEIRLFIKPPFWQAWWFKLLSLLFVSLLVYILLRRQRKIRMEKENLRRDYERKIAAVEMNTLRAQMNPHFIFNSLNSINTFILENDQENAVAYLQKFSSLVRLILDNSRNDWILLENELKALRLYIELESLRFDNVFSHIISVSPEIHTNSVWVPPLIIQPYVENAIRHGLIHRGDNKGKLTIRVLKNNEQLQIEVQDNGIGRAASEKVKSRINKLYQPSHGMQITAERLDILNAVYNVNASVHVTDLDAAGDEQTGTKISLTIQYKTNAGNNSR